MRRSSQASSCERWASEGTVRTEIGDDDVTVRIEGDNLGVLVGPRGVRRCTRRGKLCGRQCSITPVGAALEST